MFMDNLFGLFLGGFFVIVGLVVAFTPAERLLKWDRRGGYMRYKHATSHEDGVRAAGRFYRVFGIVCAISGALFAFVWVLAD